MLLRPKTAGAALVALATAGTLAVSLAAPAEADFSPQAGDVVTTGSDILQTSFNFLADGYHQLPGYNTAGNRWRFVNFDSSGDAQGRSAFADPRMLPTETIGGVPYVKRDDVKLLNPTISLRAGQDLVVRPSGGGGGGLNAILNDKVVDGVGGWIDVGRSPNRPNATQQGTAENNLGTRIYSAQLGIDRQLIAVAEETNAPTTLTGDQIRKIYNGAYTTWGQVPGYNGPGQPLSDNPTYTGPAKDETIVPLTLPADAGMWSTFLSGVKAQTSDNNFDGVGNPNKIQVQQNDPTAITSLTPAKRVNAIVPFPRGRYKVLQAGYYTQAPDGLDKTNPYNGTTTVYPGGKKRVSALPDGVKLLDPAGTAGTAAQPNAPYGTNFGYNALFRKSDLDSTTPWQPGSTLNWVQALFYNPDGPAPFVDTPAGRALLEAAGIQPDYQVYDDQDHALID